LFCRYPKDCLDLWSATSYQQPIFYTAAIAIVLF